MPVRKRISDFGCRMSVKGGSVAAASLSAVNGFNRHPTSEIRNPSVAAASLSAVNGFNRHPKSEIRNPSVVGASLSAVNGFNRNPKSEIRNPSLGMRQPPHPVDLPAHFLLAEAEQNQNCGHQH